MQLLYTFGNEAGLCPWSIPDEKWVSRTLTYSVVKFWAPSPMVVDYIINILYIMVSLFISVRIVVTKFFSIILEVKYSISYVPVYGDTGMFMS